jgi:outer membrane lipoprotein-sorting protein
MRKIFFYAILVLFVLASNQAAQAQSPASVLKRAAKAMGGEKALRGVRSWQATGKIVRLSDGATGNYQAQAQQPNYYTGSYDLNGFEVAVGYNGRSSWMRDSQNGLRTLTGQTSRDFQTEAAYRAARWLDYKKEKSKIAAGGQADVNGKPAQAVILTTAKNVQIKMYFDKTSGLLVREEIPAGDLKRTFDYADFRAVNGIQEPFSIITTIGEEKYEIKLDQITHNPALARNSFDFPKISSEPLPDIAALIKEVQANEEKVENILENYTFTQTSTSRETGKDGVVRDKESQTLQVSFYKGNQIRRLIAKNGKPLETDEQERENKRVEKRVEEIEKELAKNERKRPEAAEGAPNDNGEKISIAEILRASNLVNPRRERFRSREVIVFDFEPNPNFDFKNAKSFLKFFGKTAGAIWIDAQDKQVARVEAYLLDSFKVGGGLVANLKKGASFTLEQDRINDEIWLPSVANINLSVKVLLVRGINVNQLIKYGDYKKFSSEIKDAKVEEIKKN